METIIAQVAKPSEILAVLSTGKNAICKYFERKDMADDNRGDLDRLLYAYERLKNTTDKLLQSLPIFDVASQDLLRVHADTVTRNESSLQSLKEEVQHAKLRDRVRRMKKVLEQHEKEMKEVMEFLSKTVVPILTARRKDSPEPVYSPDDNVPPNPPRLTLDYLTPLTCEGKLKAAVLQEDGHRVVGVVAVGMGGVGKTCALRGLASDIDIQRRFSGGLLYIQLGNDATLSTLISGIATLVQRTGNDSLADKLKAFDNLREAVNAASTWFRNQICLLLIDDIWLLRGINTSTLRTLATMLSNDSRLVYTTRTQTLADEGGHVIEFSALDTDGESARKMLMKHAEFQWNETLSERNEAAVRGLLLVCNGLPVAIGVVGETVRKQSKHRREDRANAWSDVFDRLHRKEYSIPDEKKAPYGPVRLVVDTSLEVLRCEDDGLPFDQMFRALCVLEKQQMVPMNMLQKLWGLSSLQRTKQAVTALHEVSLVLRLIYNERECIQLHDVILDIVTSQVSEKLEVEQFWQTLIDNYSGRDRPVGDAAVMQSSENHVEPSRRDKSRLMRWCLNVSCFNVSEDDDSNTEQQTQVAQRVDVENRRWEWWNTADDGYIHDNVCRALRGGGRVKQLLWLLSQPNWVVKRLQDGGISAVERDLDIGKEVAAVRNGGNDDHVRHLEMVGKAARLGCTRVLENKREAWFQIHGRLLSHATQCARTQRFVADMEARAPKPWAKASVGFLQQASATTLDIVSAPSYVYSVQMDDERAVCCWVAGTTVGITRYNFESGLSETQEKECGEIASNMADYLHQNHVTLSADSKMVVIGLPDGFVWIWDTESDQTKRSRERHDDEAVCVAVSEDGDLIASGSWDSTVRVWEAGSGEAVGHALVGHTAAVDCVAWSANGRYVASGSRDHTVRVWDVQRGEGVGQPLVGHSGDVWCVAWGPNGELIASGSDDRSVRVWNAQSGQQVGAALLGHSDWVLCVSWSADGTRVASGSRDFSVRAWDARSGQPLGPPLVGHTSSVYCVAWSANQRRIVSGSLDCTARVWDAQRGESGGRRPFGHTAAVYCVALNADETRALTGSADCTARMWDLRSATAVEPPFVGHTAAVQCVAWSADEKRVASGAHDGSVRVWDVDSARAVGEPLVGHTAAVGCVAWSCDGTRVASGSSDHTVRLWSVGSAQADAPALIGHSHWVLCVAWSADGQHVVSGSRDRTLRVWSARGEPRLTHTLSGHTDDVECVAWSGDGRFVVSGSRDASVRVWNVHTGEAVGPALEHDYAIEEVGVSGDGSHVLLREWGTGVRRIWRVADGECVASSRDAEWGAALRALQQQRLTTARRSWWSSGSYAVTQRRADGSDERLGTCDSVVERFGELWYSDACFAHCQVIEKQN